ncbi:MAG: universal stress protein [Betaproteobacteria bacterium]
MKILFATDGSPGALAALSTLVDNLDRFRNPLELLLLNVHPPLPYRSVGAWVGKDAVARYYDEEGDAALAESRSLLDARNIGYESVKLVGEPAQSIVTHASQAGCDFIAMGTKGHGALANLVLGSVGSKVLALSSIPLLLLK